MEPLGLEKTYELLPGSSLIEKLSESLLESDEEDISGSIRNSLEEITAFLGTDGAYSAFFHIRDGEIKKSYSWVKPELNIDINKLNNLSSIQGEWSFYEFKKKNYISVSNINDMPLGSSPEMSLMSSFGIKSLLGVPMFYKDTKIGVLLIFSMNTFREWDEFTLKNLRIAANLISRAIKKNEIEHGKDVLLNNIRDYNVELENRSYEINLLNEQLIQSQRELNEMVLTRDKFFSVIAHDLRNPISGFVNLSEMIMKEIDDYSLSEIKNMIAVMYNSANSLYVLLEDLLLWANHQIGNIRFSKELFYLGEVFGNTIDLLKKNAEQKSIEITSIIAPNLLVTGDKFMVGTILRNLLANAIKFTEPGGKITLSCLVKQGIHKDFFAEYPGREYYEISVADTGIGIKPEARAKLFDLSSHYSTPGTSGEKGTGLGLILCREFVEKHGGRIHFDSTPGVGSTFYFTIPK